MRKLLKRRKKAPRTIRRLLRKLRRTLNLSPLLLLTLNQTPTPTPFQLLTLFQDPLGSFVDAAGNVWAPDGALLSQRTLSALPDATEAPQEIAPPLAPDPSSPAPPDALAPVYSIADLRPASDPSVLSGLKALISSIFGEYTPVTTTAVITETVGENVNQYLVETVASGAAGVDYEWLAGVFLFGILLFCLMKLLGGVLK